MKRILPCIFSDSITGDCKPYPALLDILLKVFRSRTLLILLFLGLATSVGFASHFKGGHMSYKYLGAGKYEFLIKGYWDVKEVGSILPRYQGFPALSGSPVTVSQTLLPDGKTVEHVQKQTVTWSQPGTYEVSWKTCCRGVGSNFDNNSNGLFASVNYNPNIPSSSPYFSDYPIFNFKTGYAINHSINTGDPDGHEQEYTLQLPYGLPATVYDAMLATGFQVEKDGTVKWANPLEGKWLVNIRLHEKIGGSYTGAYVDREFIISVSSSDGSDAPVFVPVQGKTIREGQTLSFEVEASDVVGQNVKLTAYGAALANGASFIQTAQGSIAKGTFTWTPGKGTAGNYSVQFVATDNQQPPVSAQVSMGVTVQPCRVLATYSTTAKPCAGSSNGSVLLSATEGVMPYSYSLDNGVTFQSTPDFGNLSAGNYTALVKDAIGCLSEPVTVMLEATPLPDVTLSLPAALCVNAGAVTLSGGYPAGGVYYGVGVENGIFDPGQAGIGSHTLYYTYTSSNGCSSTASSQITINEAPVANAGPDQNVVGGRGQQSCVTLTANATSGSLPYTYNWSTGETTQSINVCPTDTTIYTVTITDALGCSSMDQAVVNVVMQQNGGGQENKPTEPGPPASPGPPTSPGPPESPGPPSAPGGRPFSTNGLSATGNNRLIADNLSEVELLNTPDIIVFPNPVTDFSQFKVILKESSVVTIEIVDLSGRVVRKLYSGNAEANRELTFIIDRSIGHKGVYMGRVTTGKSVQVIKLLLQ